MTDQEQEYQSIPVAAARAAVQASGELEGIEGPHYAMGSPGVLNAQWWLPVFKSTDDAPHPDFARVIITRRGQKPREVVISWDEYAAELELNHPEWLEKRKQKPMSIFGAEVERHAYRVVFADVLAAAMPPRIISADVAIDPATLKSGRLMVVPDDRPAAGWDLRARDWFAEVKAADAVSLNGLTDEARAAGALAKVDGLQQAFMDRLLELEQAKRAAGVPKPVAPPRDRPNHRRGKR